MLAIKTKETDSFFFFSFFGHTCTHGGQKTIRVLVSLTSCCLSYRVCCYEAGSHYVVLNGLVLAMQNSLAWNLYPPKLNPILPGLHHLASETGSLTDPLLWKVSYASCLPSAMLVTSVYATIPEISPFHPWGIQGSNLCLLLTNPSSPGYTVFWNNEPSLAHSRGWRMVFLSVAIHSGACLWLWGGLMNASCFFNRAGNTWNTVLCLSPS